MGCGSSSSAQTSNGQQSEAPVSETTQGDSAKSPPRKKSIPQEQSKSENKDGLPDPKQFLQDAVEHHNKLRSWHEAAPLVAADDLLEYSQKWADDLAKRDTMEHSKCKLPSGGRVGENIYYCWSSGPAKISADKAIQSWYDEIKDYDFNNPGFDMKTGHFTQVVWKGSTELGMAYAKSAKGSIYVVANYRPGGNMLGDFPDNVIPK